MTTNSDKAVAKEMVDIMHRPDGDPKLRPIHTNGIGVTGFFKASETAAEYSNSEPFQGNKIPVTIRFSNASGNKTRHDGWSDIRGMATRFHLNGPQDFDLIAMTLQEFFTPDVPSTLEFLKAARPTPYHSATPLQKIRDYLSLKVPKRNRYPHEDLSPDDGGKKYANKHKFAQLPIFQTASIGAPVSYARAAYHAVHTFIITAPNGKRNWVRFTWQPVAGVRPRPIGPDNKPDDDYLNQEIRDRLSDRETARFTLMMSLGEQEDEVNNCTKPWPLHRTRIVMGMLTLNHVLDAKAQESKIEKMSYNPCLLPEGIEPSDDPILHIRRTAYEISSKERHANRCPFAGGQ